VRPRQHDANLVGLFAHVENHRPHALVGLMTFAGNLFALGQDGFDPLKVDDQIAAFPASNASGDDLSFAFEKFFVQAAALGLADALDEHLLGRLGSDAGQVACADRLSVHLGGDFACRTVDVNRAIFGVDVGLANGRHHGRFEVFVHRLFVDVFVPREGFDDSQQFLTHVVPSSRTTAVQPNQSKQKRGLRGSTFHVARTTNTQSP
jgi:hypothetical protein